MHESFELPSVDSLTFGCIGEPGRRVFYIQARAGQTTVTLKAEKQQVIGLAAALRVLLDDLPATGPAPVAPELEPPVEPAWAIGGIGISEFDATTQRLTLQMDELVPEDETDGGVARIGVTLPQVLALAVRGEIVVEGGRPPCPLCGNPMDPDGHSCPKTNGHLKH